jgi:hypothetical protein
MTATGCSAVLPGTAGEAAAPEDAPLDPVLGPSLDVDM